MRVDWTVRPTNETLRDRFIPPTGQFDAALTDLERARQLDPRSEASVNGVGLVAGYTGRDELVLTLGERRPGAAARLWRSAA